jgi:hypothetical protein
MDRASLSSDCPKSSSYLIPMVIILILFVGAIGFSLWYYFTQLKPRLGMLVSDKLSGSVGFKDASGGQLLLSPPNVAAGQSSRLAIINPVGKSNLDFSLYTTPIANNTKQQSALTISSKQGSAAVPLTGS